MFGYTLNTERLGANLSSAARWAALGLVSQAAGASAETTQQEGVETVSLQAPHSVGFYDTLAANVPYAMGENGASVAFSGINSLLNDILACYPQGTYLRLGVDPFLSSPTDMDGSGYRALSFDPSPVRLQDWSLNPDQTDIRFAYLDNPNFDQYRQCVVDLINQALPSLYNLTSSEDSAGNEMSQVILYSMGALALLATSVGGAFLLRKHLKGRAAPSDSYAAVESASESESEPESVADVDVDNGKPVKDEIPLNEEPTPVSVSTMGR